MSVIATSLARMSNAESPRFRQKVLSLRAFSSLSPTSAITNEVDDEFITSRIEEATWRTILSTTQVPVVRCKANPKDHGPLPPSKHANLADANLRIDSETSSYADATHRDAVMTEYPYNPPVAPNISIPISATSEHSLSSKTLEGLHMNLATYYSFEPMRFPTS